MYRFLVARLVVGVICVLGTGCDSTSTQPDVTEVWYFGEDAKEIEHGHVVSTAGSWQAGVDGARAGIIMWAQPKVGSIYYQEYYEGEAEDIGEVLSLNETITVPFGRFEGCLKTEETTRLEPDVLEHKYYCPGLGHALTLDMEDGDTRYELIAVEGD